MNRSIFIILLFTILQSTAQNWDFFPLDSLRCYGNGYLMGIDFRDYNSNESNIDLDRFSQVREVAVDPNSQFYHGISVFTGNSILGASINIEPNKAICYFKNDTLKSEISDSFVLLNTNNIDKSWVFYENDSTIARARNIGIKIEDTPIGEDSVKTIEIWTKKKSSPSDSFKILLRCGKRFGLLNVPNLSSFRHFDHTSYFTDIKQLQPYREYTEKDFFEIFPGTEVHQYLKVYQEDGLFISPYLKKRYYAHDGNIVLDSILILAKYDFGEDRNTYDTLNFIKIPYKETNTSDAIYNPLPTTLLGSGYLPSNYGIYRNCQKNYTVSRTIGGRPPYFQSNDTFYFPVYVDEFYITELKYVQHYGLTESITYSVWDIETNLRTPYIKVKDCVQGEKLRYFNSVSNLAHTRFNLYPNPASNYITIDSESKNILNVQLIDLLGKKYSKSIENGKVDVRDLPNGVFVIQINIEGQVFSQRIVIQH